MKKLIENDGVDFVELKKKYPKLLNGSLLDYGCYSGWDKIIKNALEQLQLIEDTNNEFYISTIKEKFGMLNIYTYHASDAQEEIIHMAEVNSLKVCEYCGEPGMIRDTTGWIKVRCNACEALRQNEIKEFERRIKNE